MHTAEYQMINSWDSVVSSDSDLVEHTTSSGFKFSKTISTNDLDDCDAANPAYNWNQGLGLGAHDAE
jgi:hypothetical protein